MKKWLDKYNDDIPQAQNGIEGTMGGLTDQGFNYNGAWGGTMQMGGAMPGAVGFTYARTAGAAPANGPYAKKTKASAQDGKNVEYMELPEITVVGSKDKSTRDFYNNLIDRFSKGENTNNPFVDQEVMGNYLSIMNLGKEYGFPKVKPETKSGIYRNAKGHYNPLTKTIYADDPNTWVSEMAHHVQMKDNVIGKGLQWLGNDLVEYAKKPIIELKNAFKYGVNSSPLDYSDEDFNEWIDTSPYNKKGAVEYEAHSEIEPMLKDEIKQSKKQYNQSPAAEARIKRWFAERRMQNGGEMKFYQEGLDWKPRNISQDGSKNPKKRTLILAEYDPEYWNNPDGSASNRYTNPFITEAAGIKNYVNKYFPNEDVEVIPTYKQNIKEALAKSDPNTRLVVMGHSGDKMFGIPTTEFIESVGNTKYENCYAGICYGNKLEGIGQRNYDKELIGKMVPGRFPESYNLQNFNIRSNDAPWVGFAPVDRGGEEGFRDSFFRRTTNPEVTKLRDQIKKIWSDKNVEYEKKAKAAEPIQSKLVKIYSQNRETVNLPKAADTEELDYIPIPARTANYGKDPLTFNPQQILQKKEQGGSIISPLGQWAYPGEITTIPSNEITMQGVPYPVLGISDTGDTQMMYPGEDYEFDGESVTEYPMAKSGMSVNNADAQPIEKLDQLLNFTNYNKPTKGGWLDKYQ